MYSFKNHLTYSSLYPAGNTESIPVFIYEIYMYAYIEHGYSDSNSLNWQIQWSTQNKSILIHDRIYCKMVFLTREYTFYKLYQPEI